MAEPFTANEALSSVRAKLNEAIVQADGAVQSDTTQAGGGSSILNIVTITQADHDALSPPDTDTVYLITG